MTRVTIAFLACLAGTVPWASATEAANPQPDGGRQFSAFIQAQGAALLAKQPRPDSLEAWKAAREEARQKLKQAWGGFPEEPCPLEPRKLGEFQRDGYRVERIVFQTRPGIWMTANAYVPDQLGRLPAVLCVHGHWRGAKQDPVVQSRCIGLARHGFFVLVVDAFGAGERAVGKALGEYHGEMTGATLLPVGLPLSGLQVYENMRAVDYLLTRPEVDGERIGITGASGGGNQSEYAGAMDDRFRAVVPVCSVGTSETSLQVASCMCEIVPGKLRFTQEWGVLAMTAPRGLLVINATDDAIQFSVDEAKKSLAIAGPAFALAGVEGNVRQAVFKSPHDYNREMRETMYGWMTRHLKGSGDGSPLAEPPLQTEDPETLRCFPGDSRPDDFVTIPRFAAREARALLAKKESPANASAHQRHVALATRALREQVFGGFPPASPLNAQASLAPDGKSRSITFEPEPGLTLVARQEPAGAEPSTRCALVLDLDGAAKAETSDVTAGLRAAGWSVVTLDLRSTGRWAYDRDKIGRAPDHNTAEWALLIGRPLLGQWVLDVRRALDAWQDVHQRLPDRIAVIGQGPAGIIALAAAASDERITDVAAVGTLASYVSEVPYEGQRLGTMAPGIVRDVGDIADLAALVAPRHVVIAGGVGGGGTTLTPEELTAAYSRAAAAFRVHDASSRLRILPKPDAAAIIQEL